MKIRILVYCVLFALLVQSCIVVKNDDNGSDYVPILNFSPQPEIPMSDQMVRSQNGDMLSFLPKDWFLVPVEDKTSSEVLAVAVNPDYTISVVFSQLKKSSQMDATVDKEGLLGLARLTLDKRARKTAGSVRQVGKYSTINMGPRNFAMYEFTNADNSMSGMAAVFKSTLNEYYEMAIVPLNIKGIVLPGRPDLEKVFRSILTTVQY